MGDPFLSKKGSTRISVPISTVGIKIRGLTRFLDAGGHLTQNDCRYASLTTHPPIMAAAVVPRPLWCPTPGEAACNNQPELGGNPLIILAKKIDPNATFRVVSCIYILYDLTCLIWLKNSTHSLSYMAYRCITVLTNKTPYLSSVFTTV